MMDTTTDVIGHTKMFEEILEDGKEPRSIREIKAKYELSFPFQVKKVVLEADSFPLGMIVTVSGYEEILSTMSDETFTAVADVNMQGPTTLWWMSVDYPKYVFYS